MFHELKTKAEKAAYRDGYAAGLKGALAWDCRFRNPKSISAWRDGFLEATIERLRSYELIAAGCRVTAATLAKLPPILDLDGMRELPASDVPVIYFLLKAGQVQYVGQSINWLVRLAVHAQRRVFDRVLYLPTPLENLNDRERHFIALLRPPLNKTAGIYGRSKLAESASKPVV